MQIPLQPGCFIIVSDINKKLEACKPSPCISSAINVYEFSFLITRHSEEC